MLQLRLKSKKNIADELSKDTCSSCASDDALSNCHSEVSFTTRPNESADQFLLIDVHEARNLVAKDYDTNSSDPFVKITLAGCSKKTRVIYRNCHPLWEQTLVFPLDGVSDGEPLLVELFDRDFRKAKEFLGQVIMTLGKALEIAQDATMGQHYWFGLSKKHSTDIVGGELCLGFRQVDAVSYVNMVGELDAQMDPEHIATSLASKALHVQLKGLNGLRASGLMGSMDSNAKGRASKGLSLIIKFGRLTMEKPLPFLPAEDDAGSVCGPDDFELSVNEEVVIPLAAAIRPSPLAARRKDELFDVRLSIKVSGTNTTIAKTHIPIWDIPISDKSSSLNSPAAAADDAAASSTTPGVPGSGRSTPEAPVSLRTTLDSAVTVKVLDKAGPAGLSGLHFSRSSTDSLATSESLPTTPRGRLSTADFLLASYKGGAAALSPRSHRGCDSPAASGTLLAEELIQRSKSDVSAVLGSTARHQQSNLQTASSSNTKGLFVEGSLCSVTCSRVPAGTPANLGKKKVHGLSELNDNFRTAFKSILIPPREVSRMGWVPTKGQAEEGDGGVSSEVCMKQYCRIMESFVPMYARLELGVGLAVVPLQPTAAGSTQDAAEEAGNQLVLDADDDEDVPDATPITLPEPFDLVLQDEVVHIGVNSLHCLLLGSDSELMATHWAAEELREVVVGPWKPGGPDCLRSRQMSYIKKLNIPVPLAPKQCRVWEEHQLLVKQDGGFVAQHICTNNAPKGDCFRAMVQLCGVFVSSGTSRLRISMKLDWHKNTLGKSLVQNGAEADAKRGWARLVASLKHISSKGGLQLAGTLCPAAQQPTAPATSTDASCSIAYTSGIGISSQKSWPIQVAAAGALVAAVVVLLLLLVLVVWRGASSISSELHQLNAVLRAMSEAGKCVNPATLQGRPV